MIQSRAVVGTAHASRYLQQLAKHWSHRFETEFDQHSARIALPLGETRLTASDEALTIGGLIQEELGRIPKAGEEIRIGNCRLVVHEADPRSIRSVQIFKDEKVAPAVEAAVSLS